MQALFGIFAHEVQRYLSYKDQMALACASLNIDTYIAARTKISEAQETRARRAHLQVVRHISKSWTESLQTQWLYEWRCVSARGLGMRVKNVCMQLSVMSYRHYDSVNYFESRKFGPYTELDGVLCTLGYDGAPIPLTIERR